MIADDALTLAAHKPFGLVPITVVGGQPVQFGLDQPAQLRQHLVVVLTQRRRRANATSVPVPSSRANGGHGYRPAPVRGCSRRSKKPRCTSCGFSSPATAKSPPPPGYRPSTRLSDDRFGILCGEPLLDVDAPAADQCGQARRVRRRCVRSRRSSRRHRRTGRCPAVTPGCARGCRAAPGPTRTSRIPLAARRSR